ncbi:MAG: transporter substrate-binding domain-containing protein [Notoacmeibacter sp.]|nr:transporter substrate-binding domain-containing protein [Notoacmeibacter sp.]
MDTRKKLNTWRLVAAALLTPLLIGAPANAEGLVDQIKERGEIVVGTEAAFEPFEFMKDGKIVGYNKDILDYVVEKLGVNLNQLDLPFQGLLPGLLAKKFDLVATSTSINAERAAKYAYTRPVGTAMVMVLARADDDSINTLKDLNGKVVATQLASVAQPKLEDFEGELKSEGGSGFGETKLFTSFPETHVALASSQVDAIAIPSPTAGVLMKKVPDTFKVIGPISDPAYLAWVLRPDNGDLRDFINAAIGEMADNGKLKELQMKWFGFEMETPASGYLPEGAR